MSKSWKCSPFSLVRTFSAAAALNVLTKEKGEHYHDFDVPDDAVEAFGTTINES